MIVAPHPRTARAHEAQSKRPLQATPWWRSGATGWWAPVAGAMRWEPGTLMIVPAGRGNDFARVLGIPTEPRRRPGSPSDGVERLLDVGEVNGKPFVGIASLGFDSDANRIANEARLVRGHLVYVYAALKALAGWRPARFDVTVDGGGPARSSATRSLSPTPRRYGGGMYIVPHAELDDGRARCPPGRGQAQAPRT